MGTINFTKQMKQAILTLQNIKDKKELNFKILFNANNKKATEAMIEV